MPQRQFKANKETPNRVMVQCRSVVNKDAVTRKTIDGIEHIIITSATLPDDVVMNGGLYPADEIEKSYRTLEMSLAPVEHPMINGEYVPASDPRAINEFYAGAWNTNVRRKDGRVWIDKVINVQEAKKTDRGRRLLDRVDELETSESPRPIHTSVGVFLDAEELDSPVANASGDEYTWIARDMVFDHDAILLDSIGAAKPDQGVGMAVNKLGKKFKVCQVEANFKRTEPKIHANFAHSEIVKSLDDAFVRSAVDADWIEEVFEDKVIFWSKDQIFEIPFVLDENGIATITGIPVPVDRQISYSPKTNHLEGDPMKELILNALKEAGVQVDGLTDEKMLQAYQGLKANKSDEGGQKLDAELFANLVQEAIKPLSEEIKTLKANQSAGEAAEIEKLASLVANSGKYPGLDAETAKTLKKEKLQELAANCQSGFGLNPVLMNNSDSGNKFAPTEMPE